MTGRIIEEHKSHYTISSGKEVLSAVVRGTFHQKGAFPKVGDYVEFEESGSDQAVIEKILPRKTEITRTVLPRGKRDAVATRQVIVANVDRIFIVMGLDQDFNVSRAERYALLAKQSGVNAVIILNKSDVVSDPEPYLEKIGNRLPDIPVHAVSATTGSNMEEFIQYFNPDTTAVLLGSSGAGKSTIINWLLRQEHQATGVVRQDDSRGRHTTTSRQLFSLPTGGYLIDTPGMRELGVLSTAEDEAEVFASVDVLKEECRFSDCDHKKSKGCAIQEAINSGNLDRKLFENYLKLKREREYLESRVDEDKEREYTKKRKKLHKSYLSIQKHKRTMRDSF